MSLAPSPCEFGEIKLRLFTMVAAASRLTVPLKWGCRHAMRPAISIPTSPRTVHRSRAGMKAKSDLT